jgi:glutamate racemase
MKSAFGNESVNAIGVFDSGVGGLTVLKTLRTQFPKEKFIYLGDTARVPYGNKSPETVRRYTEEVMDYLVSLEVKAIVIACNSASSQVPELMWKSVPVFSVIQPGAREAFAASPSKKIGIIGTRTTIQSQVYKKALESLGPCEVFQQACPLFVPLVEEAWTDDPVTNLIVYRYLSVFLQHQIDTLVLGCTHYPLLKKSIQKVLGSEVRLIESGEAVAEEMRQRLSKNFWQQNIIKGDLILTATDAPEHLFRQAQMILGGKITSCEIAVL